ncbi:MAG: glycosyltransferase family 4 protein [Burkholderiales bacterium]|nr:glycosyltransferase family 4 protein [Burkholderiales bacterium]MDE2396798.1 glycosyltransferase family 4 protein [Burkholderiales bacterium]MDE2456979.1 glycosyltransferase family 4 protein [Burkholderiales bacterium]
MISLLVAFAISLCATLLVVRSSKVHARLSMDSDVSGPQKFHAHPVPRVGGLGIVAGLIAAEVLAWNVDRALARSAGLLLLCGVPAFAAGLIEDLTKRISPRARLLATAASALLAVWLLDASIRHTAIPGLDWVTSWAVGSAILTVFAVAGIANSVNIIDGFNGLASMCVILMLAALAYVAFQCGDLLIGNLALAGIGAVLGFFIWNFPAGLIFLGDGGAYFLGFFFAELSILLLHRNPGSVSPLFPLLVCIYPVFETLFSIYRRKFLRAVPPSMPDGIHLHSLIYRRVMRWAVGERSAKALTRRNSMTSPYLWLLCMFSIVPAVLFWSNTTMLAICLGLFAVSYVVLYWRIVRFKSPRWLRMGVPRAPVIPEGDNRRT